MFVVSLARAFTIYRVAVLVLDVVVAVVLVIQSLHAFLHTWVKKVWLCTKPLHFTAQH